MESSHRIRKYLAPAAVVLLLCVAPAHAQTDFLTFTGVWSTVPISGLTTPSALTGDVAGNLYITDTAASSIIKIAADGTQSAVGSGLNSPQGITEDAAGNLYVSSFTDSKVYKITPVGVQTALSSGWSGPAALAVDSSGNLFVADITGLSELTPGGTKTLLVSSATILGVAVDSSDNIYYGDSGNTAVYEILQGTTTPNAHNFSSLPKNLFVDQQGSVFMAETATGVMRSDDSYGDTTIFGDAVVSAAVWGDSFHNLYIADTSGSVEKLALGAVDFGSLNLCPTNNVVAPCSQSQTLHFGLDLLVNASVTTRAVTEGAVGLDYAITGDTCTGDLGDGNQCTMTLTFTPQAAGLRTGAAQAIGSSVVDDVAPPAGPSHARASRPSARSGAHVSPRDEPAGTELSTVLLHGIGLAPVGGFTTAPIEPSGYKPLSGNYLYGLTFSTGGIFYVTDLGNCIVQQVEGSATATVAGSVCAAASGDGGLATAATFPGPLRTAVDGAGNLYIVDWQSRSVRKVDSLSGIVTTVAGNGSLGYTGDAGPAMMASFDSPEALAVDDAGDLYIADSRNNVVRRVDAVTGIITTIVGNGSSGYSGDGAAATGARLNFPDALAIDSAGNLYIADDGNNVIRKVAGGVITAFAGTGTAGYSGDGGLATSAALNDPEGLALDTFGNVYIADSENDLVRKVNATTGIITTVAGTFNNRVETYTGDGGEAVKAGLSYTEDVSVDTNGVIYIADSDNDAVRVVITPLGLANFGTVALGSSSAPQDVGFSNTGTAPLVVTSLQATTDFSLGGADTTCTASRTLAPNAACIMGIELVPIADGELDGAIDIIDNFGNNPTTQQEIFLEGTGTGSAPTKLAFAAAIPPILAGGNLGTIPVDVEDSGGAVVTGATSPVTLTITGPGGYSQVEVAAAVNGVASFNLSALPLSTPGVYTLTATSTGLVQAQTQATVSANAAAPAKLAFPPTLPTAILAGGNLGTVPVDVENTAGVIVEGATNPVTLTITGSRGYSQVAMATAVNGVASFNLSALLLSTPDVYTLTATSAGLSQAQATITVMASSATTPAQLAVASPVPAMLASGGNLGIVMVDVDNSSGTVLTSADNTITLTIDGPNGYNYTVTVVAVNGIAAFDLSAVTLTSPGTYTLTAASGRLRQAFATVTVTVDFNIVVTTSTPAAAGPIEPGTAAGFSFTLAPASGTFASPITLTATGMPAGATYSFSPVMVTPGSSAAATMMTIQTAAGVPVVAGRNDHESHTITGWGTLALGLLLLPLSGSRRMRRVFRRAPLLSLALLFLALGMAGLSGCGVGGLFGQPQQSYTITVTGTSGVISHSVTVTLTVQ